MHRFAHAAHSTGRAENYKVWTDDNHAIMLEGAMFDERLQYIHQNPVKQMIILNEADYIMSSATDYCGKKGLIKVKVI